MKLLLLAHIIILSTAFSSSRNLQETLNNEVLFEGEASFVNFLPAIRANSLLHDMFNFGLQSVIAVGISRGTIPKRTFNAFSVSNWTEYDTNNVSWFTFTAVATSEIGICVIEMKFKVYYDWIALEKVLVSYTSKTITITFTGTTTIEDEEEIISELNDELTLDFIGKV